MIDPDCRLCHGSGKAYPEHIAGGYVALDTVPGYDPRVPCPCTRATDPSQIPSRPPQNPV
jgi:hypothetical protein